MITSRRLAALAALAAAAALAAVWPGASTDAGPHHDHGPFVVHEWGTFTSMQGASGVELDGLQHESERLPEFVHALTRPVASPFRAFGDESGVVRQTRRTRSKMETPVVYFYSDIPRRVTLSVRFLGGILTHYFPAPAETAALDGDGAIDLGRVGTTETTWRVDVVPGAGNADGIPALPAGNHYGFARDVAAAPVRSTTDRGERERFVFYRGLGSRNPAIRVTAGAGGALAIDNREGRIPAAFAVEIDGDRARFTAAGSIGARREARVALGDARWRAKDDVVADLARAVETALIRGGLYRDEARAMVATWRSAWFGRDGARLLYLVPRSYVDRVLPLEITPTPDETVRVFVGRIELLTPEDERTLEAAVRDSASADDGVRAAAMHTLAARGRFLEPALRRVAATTGDGAVRDRARALVGQLSGAGAP